MASSKNTKPARCGFIEDGQRYVVRDVHLIEKADSHLFNDGMEVQINHRGGCRARFIQPSSSEYSENLRCFYLRDDATGKFWSVPFDPVQAEPDEFEFSAGLGDIQWKVLVDGIEAEVRLVVPRDDQVELWTVTVNNKTRRSRSISVYSYLPIGQIGWIHQIVKYDPKLNGIACNYFPYYVKVEDYYKLRDAKNRVFCLTDRKPTSYEANIRDFIGGRALHSPAQLQNPKLKNGESYHEPAAGIMQFRKKLAANASFTTNFAFGPAKEVSEITRIKKKYLKKNGIEDALKKVYAYQKKKRSPVQIDTPDQELNCFVNTWLPFQTSFCGGLLRMDGQACARNAFQDSMGIVYNDPDKAKHWLKVVFSQQDANGWIPHGIMLAEGVTQHPINTIPHRDMNAWGAPVLYFYLVETGDLSILEEKVQFADDSKKVTIYEHVCRGLEWQLKDRSKRKLSKIGEGDWNDPLNMAGWREKGESIWLTQALVYALDNWAEVAEFIGDDKRAKKYRQEAKETRKAINKYAWKGNWYARGTTDAGKWFGVKSDPEGKIYLNSQSWAIMCEAADTKRRKTLMKAVEKYLMTPSGTMGLYPAYTGMREDIGKLSLKTPGSSENGSIYCHSAIFYAFALYCAHESEEAFEKLRVLLSGGGKNTITRTGQLPLYIPNYYRGTGSGKSAGLASGHWGTGTVAWFYRTVVSQLLGVRAEFNGLRLDPQLPKAWKKASVWRKFRGAEFDIQIKKSRKVKKIQVVMDGEKLAGNFVPVQAERSKHEIVVTIPG